VVGGDEVTARCARQKSYYDSIVVPHSAVRGTEFLFFEPGVAKRLTDCNMPSLEERARLPSFVLMRVSFYMRWTYAVGRDDRNIAELGDSVFRLGGADDLREPPTWLPKRLEAYRAVNLVEVRGTLRIATPPERDLVVVLSLEGIEESK
jgi:hypothetical protein